MEQTTSRDARPWRGIVFLASAGAAALHFAAARPHLEEYAPAGWFMVLTGCAQLTFGLWIASGATRKITDATLALNAGLIGLWAWSRAFGLPFGPDAGMREDIHSQDLLATLLAIVVVAALLADARGMTLRKPAAEAAMKLVGFGALLATAVTAHQPALEHLVGTAALLVALALRLCSNNLQIVISAGRNHVQNARHHRDHVRTGLALSAHVGPR